MAERKDCWTLEDDSTLAETVLTHIRSGSSQLAAFEEVSERLSRTAAACGFRWNSEVRKHYSEEIKAAKNERHMNKSGKPLQQITATVSKIEDKDPLSSIITLAQEFRHTVKSVYKELSDTKDELKRLSESYKVLQDENAMLRQRLENERPEVTLNDDYQALIRILDTARKMGFMTGEGSERVALKMDQSGNLEVIKGA